MTRVSRPLLSATPETAAAFDRAASVAFLVGGYDGSGNFGDLAQLDATLALLEALDDELLVLPVIELSRLRDHAEMVAERMIGPPLHILYMGPGEPPEEDRLVPLLPAANLEHAALLLYGGGYLNPLWGRRKLDMLAAAEGLAEGARRVVRLGSGLQAEPDWLASPPTADRDALARFELLGSRDPGSRRRWPSS